MARRRVRIDRDGLDKVRAAMKKASGSAVKVGVLGSEGSDQVMIATWNEFGTETIPERSFMRSTMRAEQDKYTDAMAKGMERVLSGKMSVEQVLGLVGLQVVSDVQKTITDLDDPPNADATIERKGSSNPLIDTGRMRQSISFDVVNVKPEDRQR